MAITERYVRSDAAGGGNGTTDAASGANGAFTWAEMVTDLNTPRAGYRYNVKAGTYTLAANTTLTGDGSATKPNIIRGFNSTAGDLDSVGRGSGGALTTTNFPVLAYDATYSLNLSGSDYIILQNIKVTTSNNSRAVYLASPGSYMVRCYVGNTYNGTNAGGVLVDTLTGGVIDCDIVMSGADHSYGISSQASSDVIVGCRITAPAGVGIETNAANWCVGNTIYDSESGITTSSTTGIVRLISNTIVGCTTGIKYVASTTNPCVIVNNHITDCLTAIDWQTSTCAKLLAFNRTRDNTSGFVNTGASDEWVNGTQIAHVTTDTGDGSTDFTSVAGDDYSLIAGAPATSKGPGYLVDIGANGTPVVTAGATQGHVIGG